MPNFLAYAAPSAIAGGGISLTTMISLGADASLRMRGRRDHCATELTRCRSIDALEQSVEMRNILKAGSKCDFRNLPVSRIVEQITRAGRYPPIVDVLANRASGSGKELVYVTL